MAMDNATAEFAVSPIKLTQIDGTLCVEQVVFPVLGVKPAFSKEHRPLIRSKMEYGLGVTVAIVLFITLVFGAHQGWHYFYGVRTKTRSTEPSTLRPDSGEISWHGVVNSTLGSSPISSATSSVLAFD
ncbi:hypothetical protein IscW_ISCW005207 [Ixodes scapularis]|uniref:Uncharacterized protein n=1 Tax=Ixodes scapularis TaxID=6945 RepID=B7PEC6_IXOSC|nr:hypothetical protein IscW_ISCW005207 [Ixodes scapularis]|eukprot:XP_002433548.1 hypothetical protein IscW_ISCW005207 [Ixodes scapularis]